MAAPASEDLRELERDLTIAAETDEPVTRAMVQERFGVGASEAGEMLEALREHGKAVEFAPGEWRGPTQDELDRRSGSDAPRVMVEVSGEGHEIDDLVGGEGADGRPGHGWTGDRVAQVIAEPTVRLTRGVAEALDAEAVGKIVHAALDGLEDGEIFVLEVTP